MEVFQQEIKPGESLLHDMLVFFSCFFFFYRRHNTPDGQLKFKKRILKLSRSDTDNHCYA